MKMCYENELFRFRKSFENPCSFDDPVASISEYEDISDAVLFGFETNRNFKNYFQKQEYS